MKRSKVNKKRKFKEDEPITHETLLEEIKSLNTTIDPKHVAKGFRFFNFKSTFLDKELEGGTLTRIITVLDTKKRKLAKEHDFQSGASLQNLISLIEENESTKELQQLQWIVHTLIKLKEIVKAESDKEKLEKAKAIDKKVRNLKFVSDSKPMKISQASKNNNSSFINVVFSVCELDLNTIIQLLHLNKSIHGCILDQHVRIMDCIRKTWETQQVEFEGYENPWGIENINIKKLRKMCLLLKYLNPKDKEHAMEIKRHNTCSIQNIRKKVTLNGINEKKNNEQCQMINYMLGKFPDQLHVNLKLKFDQITPRLDLDKCKSCEIIQIRTYFDKSDITEQVTENLQRFVSKFNSDKIKAKPEWEMDGYLCR